MILLDAAPVWTPFAFIGAEFLIIAGISAGIIFLAVKLIKKAISKNREE